MHKYNYTNSLGWRKSLIVNTDKINENGRFPVSLWCLDNGEFCGNGDMTYQELKEYLEHFGIAIDF